jgi:hypothetical protein
MSTTDFLQGRPRPAGGVAHARAARAAPPDYHALGTFAETWAFLEFFLERCLTVAGGETLSDQPLSIHAKLEALESLDLRGSRGAVAALCAEVRTLALTRQAVLQDLARASLNRLGLDLFDIPAAALGPNAAPSPFGNDKALGDLHMRTCELVRRAVLLVAALEKAGR